MSRFSVYYSRGSDTNTIEDFVIKIVHSYIVDVDFSDAETNKLAEALNYVFDCRIEIRERMEGLDLVDCVNSGEFFVIFHDIIKEAYRIQKIANVYEKL